MKFRLNIANQITIIRIIAIPVYLVFLYMDQSWSNVVALFIFIFAGFSDLVDGLIARKYNMITDLGKILDPIADKILVAAALIALIELDRLPGWVGIVMLSRDFTMAALRDLAVSKGIIIAADDWGKIKTGFQMSAIGMLSLKIEWVGIDWLVLGTFVMYAALILSLYSAYIYFRDYFAEHGKMTKIS